jgi:G3E family GTPase
MTKIDIYSGFLGAGKTTLIKKLIKEAYAGEQVVLIENEFGEIGIDGGFLKDAGINITEMNSGCICCSLVGDFAKALKKVSEEYHPDRIVIEPSGVGKLSDVIKAVAGANLANAKLNAFCTVVDAGKCKMYMKNFGEFFNDQVANACCIILSHTDGISEEKLAACVAMLKEKNASATIVTAPWSELDGKTILDAMEKKDSLDAEMERLREQFEAEKHEHHHHHHHDDDDDDDDDEEHEHHHHHHHDDDDDEEEHEHHHHHDDDDDDDEEEHEHHHHHDDDDDDDEEEHEHHHHHHADEVFTSWGIETTHKFTAEELKNLLGALKDEAKYGTVLRAKGIVAGDGKWLHFDYVPEEIDVRTGSAAVIGRLCVIGCKLNEEALKELFKA